VLQETTKELSVEITQETRMEGPPSSTTPADTVPTELISAEAPRDLAAIAEVSEVSEVVVELHTETTLTATETQSNVLGIDVSVPALELNFTSEAPSASADDTNGDGGWGLDETWNTTEQTEPVSSPTWGSSGGGGSTGWGSSVKAGFGASKSSWSMPAAPKFGGLGSTLAGFGNLLGADGRKSSKPSPKPGSSLLPAEHTSSLGSLGSLAGSISNLLVTDDKKSPVPSPKPDASPLPLHHVLAHAGGEPPAAPVQMTEESPVPADAPTNAADAVPPAPEEVAPPSNDAAEKVAEETPPVDTNAAPGEPAVPTGDGEADPEEDKEEVEEKKAKTTAPQIKASNSKGGKKKKKK
jgi:hypothetical protein